MRWIKEKKISDKQLERRVGVRYRVKFLWFPRTIGEETRWWEWAMWKEKRIKNNSFGGDFWSYSSWED